MGTEVLYHFDLKEMYKMSDLPYFALLGIITGLLSLYFTKVYLFLNVIFKKLKNIWVRLLLGGSLLGALIYLFPALYGEGYEVINQALNGNLNAVIESPLLSYFVDNPLLVFLVVFLVILLKSFATSLTIASGGVGGIFAPTLFNGSIIGLLFAQLMTHFGKYLPASNFALVGMAGTIAGVLHAPLTAIFLIAEISGGYQLLIPLMIVSLISFITTRAFMSKSVYTFQLAERGQLLTHHADNNILKMMDVRSLLETDFKSVKPDAKLRDLVDAIQQSNRNIFPVVDEAGVFKGMISMEDVRKIIFKPQLYYSVTVDSLMIQPQVTILPNETMNSIASKLHKTSYYNIPVLDDNNHYLGFVSRANVFSEYRKLLKDFSSE
jgi:CIC family chloride channel protein